MELQQRWEHVSPAVARLVQDFVRNTQAQIDAWLQNPQQSPLRNWVNEASKKQKAELKQIWPTDVFRRDGAKLFKHAWSDASMISGLQLMDNCIERPTSRLRAELGLPPDPQADESEIPDIEDHTLPLDADEIWQHGSVVLDKLVDEQREQYFWMLRRAEYRPLEETDLPRIKGLFARSRPKARHLQTLIDAAHHSRDRNAVAEARKIRARLAMLGFIMENFQERIGGEPSYAEDIHAAIKGDDRFIARCLADSDTGKLYGVVLFERGDEAHMRKLVTRGSVGGSVTYESADAEAMAQDSAFLQNLTYASLLVTDVTDPASRYITNRLVALSLKELRDIAKKSHQHGVPRLLLEVHEDARSGRGSARLDLRNRAGSMLFHSLGFKPLGKAGNFETPTSKRRIAGSMTKFYSEYTMMTAALKDVHEKAIENWNAQRSAFNDNSVEEGMEMDEEA